ncbi:MAG: NAD-dependent dehydratase [Candidatus Levybacteria bacterium CG10_big_fil_rev_8_21_14_0_10_35_13]|nr:MAG: NAD-dependent dehydratase [Candidatus Levybacteria bacterium CG10_big_fil_rev_8_21_14_0_10_35_13]
MKLKKVLVTGGAGLLGKSIIPLLLKKHYSVVALDINESKIPKVKFIKGNFNDKEMINKLLKDMDVVIHLAAMLGVDECRLSPEKVMKVNYQDTKTLIESCISNNVKKFIFTSSSEVYGNSLSIPYREDNLTTPVSTYGKSKVMVEEYLKEVANNSKMKVGIVRLFNVYGYYQRKSFVVPMFIEAALKDKPLIIFGDGTQTRSFTYVTDAARGIIKFLDYDGRYEIVNIGRNKEYTVNDLARVIFKNLPNSKSIIKYVKYGSKNVRDISLEIKRRVPSVEKAKNLFNFSAKTSLEDGVREIVIQIEKNKIF